MKQIVVLSLCALFFGISSSLGEERTSVQLLEKAKKVIQNEVRIYLKKNKPENTQPKDINKLIEMTLLERTNYLRQRIKQVSRYGVGIDSRYAEAVRNAGKEEQQKLSKELEGVSKCLKSGSELQRMERAERYMRNNKSNVIRQIGELVAGYMSEKLDEEMISIFRERLEKLTNEYWASMFRLEAIKAFREKEKNTQPKSSNTQP